MKDEVGRGFTMYAMAYSDAAYKRERPIIANAPMNGILDLSITCAIGRIHVSCKLDLRPERRPNPTQSTPPSTNISLTCSPLQPS